MSVSLRGIGGSDGILPHRGLSRIAQVEEEISIALCNGIVIVEDVPQDRLGVQLIEVGYEEVTVPLSVLGKGVGVAVGGVFPGAESIQSEIGRGRPKLDQPLAVVVHPVAVVLG